MKNNKGITLASLVLTIIVLLILASIFIYSGVNTVRYTKFNKAKSEISVVQTNVNSWYQELKNVENTDEYKALQTDDEKKQYKNSFLDDKGYGVTTDDPACSQKKLDDTLQGLNDKGIEIENFDNYRFLSSTFLENKLGLNVSYDYLANIEDRIVILFGGLEYNGEWYYTMEDFGLINIQSEEPINTGEFSLRQGYDKEIIISELKFKDSGNNEINISKFKVLYAKDGTENWNDITSSLTKYTDRKDNKVKYKFPVDDYSDYKVKVVTIDNKKIAENNVNVHFKGNAPKLSEGMIPIIYDTTSKKWEITEEKDPDWFDYTQKVWANVMLSDGIYKKATANLGDKVEDNELGSMFTWIPRYAYSINEFRVTKDGEGTTQNIFNVSLILNTTNSDQNNVSYDEDYNIDAIQTGAPTPKILHPAFSFNGNKLTGFWVAKFEASMAEDNQNTVTDNNVTTKTIKILPNADSWRYINVGNSFLNCLNMKNNSIYGLSSNADTHLMKNIEWGAVAYLAGSQYGITPTINDNKLRITENSTIKYHAYTGGNDYKANISHSTTENETGIYDLNGGIWERVAAYWDNGNEYLSGQGTSIVFPSNKLNSAYEKYWDKYEVSENEITEMNNGLWTKDASANSIRKEVTDDRYNLMKNKKGDALYEVTNIYLYYGKDSSNHYTWLGTSTGTSQNYNSDFARIGNTSLPFLGRGGYWGNNDSAGIFAFYGFGDNYTAETYFFGFRPTLIVE